jgi:hypothetical protein
MSRVTGVANATAGALRTSMRAAGFAMGSFLTGISAKMLIRPSMDMQYWKQQMGILLKDAEKTSARMDELYQFSLRTPYTMPQVVQANRILETLTKGALSTGKAFEMVANAAAMAGTQGAQTGEDFANVAVWMGRLYTGLTKGVPVGEAMMRLQELGILSSDVRYKLEALQKSGQKGEHVWAVFTEDLKRFDGAMEKLNRTMTGKISNLSDAWWAVRREVGDEVLPELLRMLNELLKSIDQLRASGKLKEWGKDVAATLNDLYKATKALVGFLTKHHEILKTLGMGYVGFRVLSGLYGIVANATRAVQGLGAAWEAAGGKAARAGERMAGARGAPGMMLPAAVLGSEQARQAAARASILAGMSYDVPMSKAARGYDLMSGGDTITGDYLLEMRRRQLARGIHPSIGAETLAVGGGIKFTGSIRTGTDRYYSSAQNMRDLGLRKSGAIAELQMATQGMQQASAATRDFAAALGQGYKPLTVWTKELGGLGHVLGGIGIGVAMTALISNWGKLADEVERAADAASRVRATTPTGEKYKPGGVWANIWGTYGLTEDNWLANKMARALGVERKGEQVHEVAPTKGEEVEFAQWEERQRKKRDAVKAQAAATKAAAAAEAAGPTKEELARQQQQFAVQNQLADRVRVMGIRAKQGVATDVESAVFGELKNLTGEELFKRFGGDQETAADVFTAWLEATEVMFQKRADKLAKTQENALAMIEERRERELALQEQRMAARNALSEAREQRREQKRLDAMQRTVDRRREQLEALGDGPGEARAARRTKRDDDRQRERDAAMLKRAKEIRREEARQRELGLNVQPKALGRRAEWLLEKEKAEQRLKDAQAALDKRQFDNAVKAHKDALALSEKLLSEIEGNTRPAAAKPVAPAQPQIPPAWPRPLPPLVETEGERLGAWQREDWTAGEPIPPLQPPRAVTPASDADLASFFAALEAQSDKADSMDATLRRIESRLPKADEAR